MVVTTRSRSSSTSKSQQPAISSSSTTAATTTTTLTKTPKPKPKTDDKTFKNNNNNNSNNQTRKNDNNKKEPFAPKADISSSLNTSHPYPALLSPRLRFSYSIARGEQGVLTFEPYKGHLLPHWRFRTPAIARESAETLFARFANYGAAGDFVGMDMARKFIQMGMTRAKRYANYAGGRKYDRHKGVSGMEGRVSSVPKQKSADHEGREDKLRASEIFRGYWHKCKDDATYARLRDEWVRGKQVWDSLSDDERLKREEEEEDSASATATGEVETQTKKEKKEG